MATSLPTYQSLNKNVKVFVLVTEACLYLLESFWRRTPKSTRLTPGPTSIQFWSFCNFVWHTTRRGRWTFSLNLSSIAPTVWEQSCLGDIFTQDQWVSELINEWKNCLFNSPGYTSSVKYYINLIYQWAVKYAVCHNIYLRKTWYVQIFGSFKEKYL